MPSAPWPPRPPRPAAPSGAAGRLSGSAAQVGRTVHPFRRCRGLARRGCGRRFDQVTARAAQFVGQVLAELAELQAKALLTCTGGTDMDVLWEQIDEAMRSQS
jgi:hypothetical protein